MLAVMRGHRIAVVLIAAGFAVFAAPVGAQPGDEIEMEPEGSGSGSGSAPAPTEPSPVAKDPKLAKKLLFAAQQMVAKGDYWTRAKRPDDAKAQYETALTAFQKAIELGDDPNVYFELANVEDKLGKLDEAAKHWRVVIKAQTGVRPDILKKATAKFDDAVTKLGLVTLVIKPDGASISMAGTAIGTSPLPESMILMPGTYAFAFSAEGFQSKELEIKVEEGSESERGIDLEPVQLTIEPAKPEIEEPIEPAIVAKPPSKLPLYLGGGATVGFLGIATITGILAVGQHGTFTAADSSSGERTDARSSGERLARITDVMLVGTLGAAAFTTYWYMFKYKPAHKKFATEQQAARRSRPLDSSSKVTVVPWVQHDTGGVTLAGSF
jgi:hypothetical protein